MTDGVIGIRGGAIGMGTVVVIGMRNTMETNNWGACMAIARIQVQQRVVRWLQEPR